MKFIEAKACDGLSSALLMMVDVVGLVCPRGEEQISGPIAV